MKSFIKFVLFLFFFSFLTERNVALAFDASHSIFKFTHGLPHTKIPFKFIQNMIVLPVTLNGKDTFNFILDTGTRTPVMLHKKTLQHLNLPRGRNISFSGPGLRGMVSGFTVDNIRLSMPGVEARNISIVVLEKNYLHLHKLDNVEIHGIIGATLFRSFVVNIDYPNQVIYLIDKNTFRPCAQYTPIEMQIIDSKPVIVVEFNMNNESYWASLMVDTGFNNEFLLKTSTIALSESARYTRLGRGFGGMIRGKAGILDHLTLNTLTIHHVNALFPTEKSYPTNGNQIQHEGILGNGLLKMYDVILDYAGEMLYIKQSQAPGKDPSAPVTTERIDSSQTEAFSNCCFIAHHLYQGNEIG